MILHNIYKVRGSNTDNQKKKTENEVSLLKKKIHTKLLVTHTISRTTLVILSTLYYNRFYFFALLKCDSYDKTLHESFDSPRLILEGANSSASRKCF